MSVFLSKLKMLVNRGLLTDDEDRIILTERGLLLGNEVFEQFIAVLSDEGGQ